ncbi:MAG: response regulator [Massilia sp.]|jgi:two-component system phosphate regulon response regulator PhoB|uniref:Two-component system phosphate regulon response regulator PhoB n=1 Tax=Massilia aurea TaxID=373040 RepID=A0A7W9U6S1_9BURK|nr:response regulator [Massilia aurea]MBB6132620.1 two-component system phosphate regulon response regulator PhoB [Massilia aurea]MBD8627764.1 response regulator [Oxalobacteraceae sp. CFBP 8753]MBD8722831.1 response regulator [Oxalobacteraceae sp. CFBP 13708]
MADTTSVLVVEDEPAIVELVTYSLREAGWEIRTADTAAGAWDSISRGKPDLLLLDWMLPDQSGLRLLSRLRADRDFQELPVIMLTAKSMEEDKLAGLNSGADDYITKPFSPRELLARSRALLRRKSPHLAEAPLRAGSVTLDPNSCTVTVENQQIDIGNAEYKLLKYLLAHRERVFSRAQLLDKVWGDHAVIEERTVDVHVLRLRKALKSADGLIRTVRSVGYMLSEK